MTLRRLAVVTTLALAPSLAGAATPPCAPCAGIEVSDPFAALAPLAATPPLAEDAVLYVAWEAELDGTASPAAAHALAGAGATPWIRLRFRTPGPLLGNVEALEQELEAAATLAASRPERIRYEIAWTPAGADEATPPSAREYAYLVKRAAVALSGVDPDARILAGPLPADASWLEELYGEETAAYLDGATFEPASAERLAEAVAAVVAADPGSEPVLVRAPLPTPRADLLAEAARASAAGFAATLFSDEAFDPGDLAPLKLLADEFQGDLSLDRSTAPTGAREAWSFVRGSDLALRVIAAAPAGADELALRFPDPQLKDAVRVIAEPRSEVPLASARRTADALLVPIADPAPVEVLRVERASIEELEGIAEEVTVATDRQMPVEEILRRLQAFEDGQSRRLRHYQAVNATTLRFQAAAGVQAVEATFEGEVFVRQGQPFDWAWQNFYLNGVKWRGKSIPEIPLIQPEKAAAMPLEILFSKEYRYELSGTETIDGRDCWVVDFEPNVPAGGKGLYRGRVWVDREIYARVRTRAVQLGLEGEVLSNEETMEYTPIDAAGAPAPWTVSSFILPLRTVGQQLLSAFNTAVVVEKEVNLTQVVVNGPEFDARRDAVFASEATMVRDTDQGLRYLVPDEQGGGRVVKEGYDTGKLFLLGGVFYDDSLDYPLPLAGVNYIDLAFRAPERQLNAFFGGVLGIVNYADPRFLGSKLDLGVDVFGFAIKTSDQLYRDEVERPLEEVRERPARVTFNLGFPIGNFVKISTDYQLAWTQYFRADDTADDFVLPQDNLTQRLGLGIQFARSGYRLNLRGAWHDRSDWEFWGLPGNEEFDPQQKDYLTWEASASKNWYFSKFRKLGVELNWSGGRDLDRFSKYQFGFFGGNRVHGYQIGKVRAEEALAAHLTYGFEIGNLLRLDAVGDAAWATDEVSGLDRELLAGVGLQGIFMGPWETLISLDVGTPVAGPDDGISVYLVFLKLFD
ncbi:MAG: hypothetical protein KDB94_04885 [Acidobacteria bacterium]|nr:hypothetical protein [Acidobacteriota bacterium]